MSFRDLDCGAGHDAENLEPNPDISGIGVLIGFVGTAHLSIFITVGYYVFALDPDKEPHVAVNGGTTAWGGNPVDRYFVGILRKGFVESSLRSIAPAEVVQTLETAFNRCFLQLCDIQLITGIGILVAAYSTLGSGLSAYHWQMAVYLAWFANLTLLSSLTFLRKYLYMNRRQRNWRLAFMGVLFSMLFVSEIPTIFFNWPNAAHTLTLAREYNTTGILPSSLPSNNGTLEVTAANASSYAGCYFSIGYAKIQYKGQVDHYLNLKGTEMWNGTIPPLVFGDIAPLDGSTAFQSTIISILLLVFSFITRLMKLSETLSSWVRNWFRPKVRTVAHSIVSTGHKNLSMKLEKRKRPTAQRPGGKRKRNLELALFYLYTKPMVALVLLGRLYMDYYSSMASEVYWLIVSSVWGSLRLESLRKSVDVAEENKMTFGQVLSIFFLATPVLAAGVSLWPAFAKIASTPGEQQENNKEQTTGGGRHTQAIETNTIWTGPPISPAGDVESGPSRYQSPRTIQQLLEQNYYTEPWAPPMIVLAGLQFVFFTAYLFSAMTYFEVSALKVFIDYVLWFFVIQPWSCYYMILFGLVFSERPGRWDLLCHWGMCALLFFATAVFPFSWRMTHGYVFGSSGYLGKSLVYAALVVPCFIVSYVFVALCYIWMVSKRRSSACPSTEVQGPCLPEEGGQ